MLKLSAWFIEQSRWLVPARLRDTWCEAWLAELRHRAEALEAERAFGRTEQVDLLRRSLGAFSHALWLRSRDWRISLVYQNLVYGLRSWLHKPLFTLIALLTLGLGIGANTYIFSVVDGVLLHPFPYRDVDRLVALGATFPQFSPAERFIESISVPDYQEVAERSRTLTSFLAFDLGNRDLGGIDEPQRLFTAAFWGDPFETLGMDRELGRSFTEEEIRKREPVAIVSHRVWQQYLGGDPAAVGKPIIVNGSPRTLVGVMPPRLLLLDSDLWLPMWYTATEMPRSRRVLTVLARVRDGVELSEVRSELATFAGRIETDQKAESPEYTGWRLAATPFVDVWASFVGPAGPILLGAVGFVLFIACANIAGLLLARAASRRHEIAVRIAIGAGRGRLLQQLLTESSLLAVGGGLLGVGIAAIGLELTRANIPEGLPLGGIELGINATVLAYTSLLSVACGLFFGLAPSLQSTRVDVQANLASDGARSTGSGGTLFTRRVFVTSQIALSVILLAGAGLLIKSFTRLANVDPGISVENVLTMRVTLAWERYEGKLQSFYSQLLQEVEQIPGVQSAAVASQFPPQVLRDQPFQIEGRPLTTEGALSTANVTVASPRLFETLGMTLVRGRPLTQQDTRETPPVTVINQTGATRYFPNEDALGKRIKTGGKDSEALWTTVIGIVSDARNRGVDRDVAPKLFHSSASRAMVEPDVLARAHGRRSDGRSPRRARGAPEHRPSPADLRHRHSRGTFPIDGDDEAYGERGLARARRRGAAPRSHGDLWHRRLHG